MIYSKAELQGYTALRCSNPRLCTVERHVLPSISCMAGQSQHTAQELYSHLALCDVVSAYVVPSPGLSSPSVRPCLLSNQRPRDTGTRARRSKPMQTAKRSPTMAALSR